MECNAAAASVQGQAIHHAFNQDAPMNQAPDHGYSQQQPGPGQMMHSAQLAPRMHHLHLNDVDVRCEYVCSTLYKHNGVLLQFINSASIGSSNVIGGIRLKMSDITQLPAYLARYKTKVKAQAIRHLHRHLLDTQCPLGLGEELTTDDYGVSFTVATLTLRAGYLHPYERKEGPLFYCLYPGLVEPVFLRYLENGEADMAYIINVYINLLEPNKRRSALAVRLQQEELQRKEELAHQAQIQANMPNKKPRMVATGNRRLYGDAAQPKTELQILNQIVEGMGRVERVVSVPPPHFPALADPKPWPDQEDSALSMPEGLNK